MATHYVANNGTATWANSTNISTPCSIATANTNAAAGDIIYLRGGSYTGITGSFINPSNTGTAGNKITFSSYNNEDVQITGSGTGNMAINLDSDSGTVRSYIKVHDLHFHDFMQHLWIRKGTHNEISYCTCIGYPSGATQSSFSGTWSASYIYRQAQYNWVHHCTFGLWGYNATYGYDTGVVFQCGLEESATDYTKYNLIEDCEMYSGGHHVVSFNGSYNIYRRIYAHNEPWYPLDVPVHSTRTMFQTGKGGDGVYNLVDSCRIGYGGPKNKDEIGGAGGTIGSMDNIWRKNVFVNIYTDGMYVTKYSGQNDCARNHIYSNTYWHGGYGNHQWGEAFWESRYTHAIVVEEGADGTSVYDNVFKNNLFYQNLCQNGTQYSIISRYYSGGWVTRVPIFQEISSNWFDDDGDPKLTDLSGTADPTNATQYDFNLRSDSPCIDAGEFLTTITSASGSGTSFTVADAGYFYFPQGSMAAEIPSAVLVGDTIQLEGQTETATITAINWSTNTITVDKAITWTMGQGIALEYNGLAPDIGALEYGSRTPILTFGSSIRMRF